MGEGRTVVVGFGNPLRADEGIGVRVIERLAARAATEEAGGRRHVAYLDLGTSGMRLLDAVDGALRVVIVDCARMGRHPGDMVRFAPGEVRARREASSLGTHEGDLLGVLALADRLGLCPPDVVLFGIEPASLRYGRGLSPTLAARLPGYAAVIRAELALEPP